MVFKMAAVVLRKLWCSAAIKTVNSGLNLSSVRLGTHRKFPTKKVVNPFVQRRTDLIKRLMVALVQHERIQTTLLKAQQLKKYTDLLITLSQRRAPPPDLDMIQDGFILSEQEAMENMVTKRIVNRRSKKVMMQPVKLSEDEFTARCREEATNMLLGDNLALDKLYGPLKDRYKDRYGGFTQIIRIPSPPKSAYPKMAYVQLVDNELDPLPDFPKMLAGKLRVYGNTSDSDSQIDSELSVTGS